MPGVVWKHVLHLCKSFFEFLPSLLCSEHLLEVVPVLFQTLSESALGISKSHEGFEPWLSNANLIQPTMKLRKVIGFKTFNEAALTAKCSQTVSILDRSLRQYHLHSSHGRLYTFDMKS
jgi:hypothetical protein